ncbi:MerR family transcriptional regulator [Janibacter alkaliphilus]|uniref:DNA-binding transcriptional MerR regulator n=1 Tax=Janibacter alkaliphilus TaxID=1069963 RepID=A0A852X4W4_9MICO|nr:DNA-binding transcriptional MerR regulator [Janibacter alkaliphilus]
MAGDDRDLIGIGAVLERLQPDFPDVTISKIRFLESEGLITPARARSGYRRYGPADLERLRFVLTAQRDRFWPLKVIRERLEAMDRGLVPDDDGQPVVPAAADPAPAVAAPLAPLRLTAAELCRSAGIDEDTYRELVSYGLVDGTAEHHDAATLEVARAAGALVGAGIEVRHLRAFRTAAEREIGLVEHVLGTRGLRGREARADGVDDGAAAETVAQECLDLHLALLRRELDRL